jgi:hypothetical protein
MIEDFDKLDCFLFSDIPRMKSRLVKKAFATQKPNFLILEECEIVNSENWKLKNHEPFQKIFTWHDGFVDNNKYFKFNVYYIDSSRINKDLSRKQKLCVLIAANKCSNHPLELYSRRREAIRWFEKNHPDEFDLYGHDWDTLTFPLNSRLNSNKLRFFRKILVPKYPSWKGEIPIGDKKSVMEEYRFAICYENARDTPGYIMEKIFDCFFAGTVPIYWGANNVTEHIPAGCFIDKRKFNNYSELYEFMKNMSDRSYLAYLENIEDFLNSEMAYSFSSECFANTIINEIKRSLEQSCL